jgi:hypothetical protein
MDDGASKMIMATTKYMITHKTWYNVHIRIKGEEMYVYINEPHKPPQAVFKACPIENRFTGTLGLYTAKSPAAFDDIMTYPFDDP